MSFSDGWAAINLEMPGRVPRTEYSAHCHWGLVSNATGMKVNEKSPKDVQDSAGRAFVKAWNYDLWWATLTGKEEFGGLNTSMGHAVYAAGGVDYDANLKSPFKEPEDVLGFDPWDAFGERDKTDLIERFNRDYAGYRNSYPECVNMTGIYISLVSGLIDLFGWDMMLTAAGVDSRGFGEVADRYASWIQQYFVALSECDSPVVMIHDDIVWTSGAFVHPHWYREFVFPNYKKLFVPLIEKGKKILYTSDGNYTEFIDDIAGCGVNGFVMEPSTDMAYTAEKYGKTHVIVGNADTRILLSGSRDEIRAEVRRCMDIGKGCPGFFMAVGNHIPANTPVESALYYNEVYEEMSRR